MSKQEGPSKWWYLGHIFFWVITGLICYLIYKDTNRPAAKKHLIHSIWVTFAVWIPITILFAILGFLVPEALE